MNEKYELQRSYVQIASQYAAAFFSELRQKPFDCGLLDRFAKRVGQRGQVWDIGCGPGHVANYLHAQGICVCGLDLSEQTLDKQYRILGSATPRKEVNIIYVFNRGSYYRALYGLSPEVERDRGGVLLPGTA